MRIDSWLNMTSMVFLHNEAALGALKARAEVAEIATELWEIAIESATV